MKCHVNIQWSTEVCHILTKKSLSPFPFLLFPFPFFLLFPHCLIFHFFPRQHFYSPPSHSIFQNIPLGVVIDNWRDNWKNFQFWNWSIICPYQGILSKKITPTKSVFWPQLPMGRGWGSSSSSIFDPDKVLLNRRGGLGIGTGWLSTNCLILFLKKFLHFLIPN